MKKVVVALSALLALSICFQFYSHLNGGKKTVYINTPKLLMEYKGSLEARKEFEEQSKQMQSEVDTLQTQVQREIEKYERSRAGISKKDQEKAEQVLHTKQQQFMQYQESMQKKIDELNNKTQEKLLSVIDAYIRAYGEKKGYDFIIGANSSGSLVYAKESLDVTNEILEGLNSEYKNK